MTPEIRKVASKFGMLADEYDRYEPEIRVTIEDAIKLRLESEVESRIEFDGFIRTDKLHHERVRVQIGEDHIGAFEMIEWRLWTVAEPKEPK